ncbi:YciI family protein [Paenibacillus guangzhouensis]|uniref:YciI family protein n=1 Tax=Paenibacillus guangzhouensis TaxID=1473112 RepID=UPI0012670090|nr:YciI family protein [Paenibacillus guangzhouensis]
MRYMLIAKATEYTEAGVKYSREYDAARAAYKESLVRAGVLLADEALHPSATGLRIGYPVHGGEPEVTVGPFPVDQELIAGYMVIEVRLEEEAIDWARRMPVPSGPMAFGVELRKLEEDVALARDPHILAMEVDLEEQRNMLNQ